MEERKTLLEFPCDFPIKIMGVSGGDLRAAVIEVVVKHMPDFDVTTMETRMSSKGNYMSLTCTVRAPSQTKLDALYFELTAHPLVKVVL